MGKRKTVEPTNKTHGVDYIFRFTKRFSMMRSDTFQVSMPEFIVRILQFNWTFFDSLILALSEITLFGMFQAESPFFFHDWYRIPTDCFFESWRLQSRQC